MCKNVILFRDKGKPSSERERERIMHARLIAFNDDGRQEGGRLGEFFLCGKEKLFFRGKVTSRAIMRSPDPSNGNEHMLFSFTLACDLPCVITRLAPVFIQTVVIPEDVHCLSKISVIWIGTWINHCRIIFPRYPEITDSLGIQRLAELCL